MAPNPTYVLSYLPSISSTTSSTASSTSTRSSSPTRSPDSPSSFARLTTYITNAARTTFAPTPAASSTLSPQRQAELDLLQQTRDHLHGYAAFKTRAGISTPRDTEPGTPTTDPLHKQIGTVEKAIERLSREQTSSSA